MRNKHKNWKLYLTMLKKQPKLLAWAIHLFVIVGTWIWFSYNMIPNRTDRAVFMLLTGIIFITYVLLSQDIWKFKKKGKQNGSKL